jgi:hypothetical protein
LADILTIHRRIGDKYTWIVELDIEGILVLSVSSAVIESHMFRLAYRSEADVEIQDTVEAEPQYKFYSVMFHSLILKYQYSVPTARAGRDTKLHRDCNDVIRCVRQWTHLESEKIPENQRPQVYHTWQPNANFAKPDTWNYYDNEVVELFRKAWDTKKRTRSSRLYCSWLERPKIG